MTRKHELVALLDQLKDIVDDMPELKSSMSLDSELATEKKMAALTGYTESALEGKRRSAKFKSGYHYHIDPDGRVMYDVKRVYSWVRGENITASKSVTGKSASGSSTTARKPTKPRSSRRLSAV